MPVSWNRQAAAITTSASRALHAVGGDHRRLHAAAVEQPEQPQRDVEHDLDVDPGVVRHVPALGVHLLHVPPGVQPPVAVGRLEQRLQPPVAARRRTDLYLGNLHLGSTLRLWPTEPLVDGHGRRISDLRVSVTDRCNFRCQYCMPADGLPWLERERDPQLRGDRAARARRWRSMGVTDLRLTGGEPLVRRDFPRLVSMLARGARHRGPVADHQRLPARARRRRARRAPASRA